MGKNAKAQECTQCGDLIYYNGNNPCCVGYEDKDTIGQFDHILEASRDEAIHYVKNAFDVIADRVSASTTVPFESIRDIAQHDLDFHAAIWYASTEILPALEVQVVIDSNNNCHVSTGSSGFVSFTTSPVGLKLPVRCWIHTHPFGSAYFSGTDWSTVNAWLPLMDTAYVLGGEHHYGFWEQSKPNELIITTRDNNVIQYQNRGEEE